MKKNGKSNGTFFSVRNVMQLKAAFRARLVGGKGMEWKGKEYKSCVWLVLKSRIVIPNEWSFIHFD